MTELPNLLASRPPMSAPAGLREMEILEVTVKLRARKFSGTVF